MATDAPAGRGLRLARTLGVEEAGRALRDFADVPPTKVVPAIAGLLVLPILARKLAPSELGVLAIAQTLISLGWIVAGNWMTTALIRALPAARRESRLQRFSAVLLRALGLSGVAFALFACALAVAGIASSKLGSNVGLLAAAAARYGAGRATLAGLDSYVAAGAACLVVYAVALLALGERKGDAQAGLTTGTSSS